ncbi:monovalent cation/H(+) antiporter subunit G [Myxococcota bacterium]|nr:monovalent cation/H(+) antiporter subunit G [Myxococcota bacterium]MBU1431806.1 monovalent cation/H(+) antiporter subunit G [Myxococcota bacterium]MBU1896656.1 monovalent cation/H(+) antiporter subunit G [Myxococcota bacterium]
MLGFIGALITLIGAIFLFLAAIGLARMPDFYNRVQAGTKASTLGVILSLLGMGLIRVEWLPKIALIILFVILTNPLSSHALARAMYRLGLPMVGRDDRAKEDEA